MTLDSVTLLYTYISRFSVNPNYISSGKNSGKVSAINFIPNRSSLRFQLLSQMAHVRFHERKWVHTRLRQQDRTQRHTQRNRGRFGRGRYHYPRHELHVHEHPRAGCQNGKLCRFWVLVGRCSRRTQRACGTAMRSCVSLFRGVAAPLGCVIQ